MYRSNLKSVTLPVPGIIAIKVLGEKLRVVNLQYRERGPYGVGNDIIRKSVGQFL